MDEYANKLKKLNAGVDIVRLITKEELENAGCDSSSFTCRGSSEYFYATSYWIFLPLSGTVNNVWSVRSNGAFGYDYVNYDGVLGVRPVIELSKSLFE